MIGMLSLNCPVLNDRADSNFQRQIQIPDHVDDGCLLGVFRPK